MQKKKKSLRFALLKKYIEKVFLRCIIAFQKVILEKRFSLRPLYTLSKFLKRKRKRNTNLKQFLNIIFSLDFLRLNFNFI